MGLLPTKMPRGAVDSLLRWYKEHEVNCFCIDFAGTMPDPLKVRSFTAPMAGLGMLSDSLLYGINARAGKFVRMASAIPARDFFVHGFGVDVLGGSHKQAMVPPGAKGKRKRPSFRVFSPATYGYHRIDHSAARPPLPGPFRAEAILADPSGRLARLHTMDAQRTESEALSSRLARLQGNETILTYIRRKALAAPEVDTFRRTRTLDE